MEVTVTMTILIDFQCINFETRLSARLVIKNVLNLKYNRDMAVYTKSHANKSSTHNNNNNNNI